MRRDEQHPEMDQVMTLNLSTTGRRHATTNHATAALPMNWAAPRMRLFLMAIAIWLTTQTASANLESPAAAAAAETTTATVTDDETDAIGAPKRDTDQSLTQNHRGENASVSVVLDKGVMSIADHLRYTLTVVTDSAAKVEFEAVNDNFGPFRVIEYNPFGPIKMEGGSLRWQREYVLAAPSAGELRLPGLKMEFYPPVADCLTADACEMTAHGRRDDIREPKSPQYELQTDAVTIVVQTVLDDDVDLTKPRDVQPPIMLASVGGVGGSSINLMAVAVLLSLAMFAVWLVSRRRPVTQIRETTTDSFSPRQEALAALAELRDQQLPRHGQHDAFHVRLSQILRRYVADAFDIKALQGTSDEIIASVDAKPELRHRRGAIARLLALSDLAKFARSYDDQGGEQMIDQIADLVDSTSTDDDSAAG